MSTSSVSSKSFVHLDERDDGLVDLDGDFDLDFGLDVELPWFDLGLDRDLDSLLSGIDFEEV